MLWNSVESKLHSYRFKWIKRGKIFIRKTEQSKVIKIASEDVLDQLLASQNVPKPVRSNGNDVRDGPPSRSQLTRSPLRLHGPPTPPQQRPSPTHAQMCDEMWPRLNEGSPNLANSQTVAHVHMHPMQGAPMRPHTRFPQRIPYRKTPMRARKSIGPIRKVFPPPSPKALLSYSSVLPEIPPFSLLNHSNYSSGFNAH